MGFSHDFIIASVTMLRFNNQYIFIMEKFLLGYFVIQIIFNLMIVAAIFYFRKKFTFYLPK